MKEPKHLDIKRVQSLQSFILFLDKYETHKTEDHSIQVNAVKDEYLTELLLELGEINIRRNEIINYLENYGISNNS